MFFFEDPHLNAVEILKKELFIVSINAKDVVISLAEAVCLE